MDVLTIDSLLLQGHRKALQAAGMQGEAFGHQSLVKGVECVVVFL